MMIKILDLLTLKRLRAFPYLIIIDSYWNLSGRNYECVLVYTHQLDKQESFKIVDSLMVLEVFGDFYWREFS